MAVIVIGAGAAGLTATHKLREKGFDVITLEAGDRAGGRIACVKEGGYIIDTGAQFMCNVYRETIKLCEEIGLAGDMRVLPINAKIWNDGRLYDIAINMRPDILFKDLQYFFKGYSMKGLAGLLRLIFNLAKRWGDYGDLRDPNIWDMDPLSIADLVSDVANEEVLENLLQPIVSALILTEPEDMGAPLGMTCFWMTLKGLTTGLIGMRRGFGSIAERLYEINSDCVRLSTPARKVVVEGGRVRGVDTADGFIEADAVVCTVTAPVALELMPDLTPPLKGALGKASYGKGCHVALGVDSRPFPDGSFGLYLPRRSGSPIAAIGSGRFLSEEIAPNGELLHCFIYGKNAEELFGLNDGEIVKRITGEVRKYLPEIPENPSVSRVFKMEQAVFSSPPRTIHEISRAAGECSSHVEGLYLAGEYLNLGSIESAVMSAVDASEQLVREAAGVRLESVPVDAIQPHSR